MQLMTCNTCKKIVHVNAIGICLGCQMHSSEPQPDEYKASLQEKLEQRAKEIEDALQKQETKSMDVCQQSSNGKRVGKRNSQRKKASDES